MNDLSLFVIPTDRPCAEALRSYKPEIVKLASEHPVYVMVLEDRALSPEVTQEHWAALKDVVDELVGEIKAG